MKSERLFFSTTKEVQEKIEKHASKTGLKSGTFISIAMAKHCQRLESEEKDE